MPSYWMTFAAIVSTVFTLALEDEVADAIIDKLMELFNFPPEETDFLLNHYLPEVRISYFVVAVVQNVRRHLGN